MGRKLDRPSTGRYGPAPFASRSPGATEACRRLPRTTARHPPRSRHLQLFFRRPRQHVACPHPSAAPSPRPSSPSQQVSRINMDPTLRLRGLCVSSSLLALTALALAACSGTSNTEEPTPTAERTDTADPGRDANAAPAEAALSQGGQGQDPQNPQGPQGQPSNRALIEQALANARRSFELRLFEDARNEAAFALELDNQNAEAREILRRTNEILGDRVATVGG